MDRDTVIWYMHKNNIHPDRWQFDSKKEEVTLFEGESTKVISFDEIRKDMGLDIKFAVKDATDEDMDYFYKDWSLTLEGLDTSKSSLEDYYNEIVKYTPVKDGFTFYVVKGKQMNEKYGLTGSNRYKNNLNIVVCTLDSMVKPMALALPRFTWGGRWFTDIVDNNARREPQIEQEAEE